MNWAKLRKICCCCWSRLCPCAGPRYLMFIISKIILVNFPYLIKFAAAGILLGIQMMMLRSQTSTVLTADVGAWQHGPYSAGPMKRPHKWALPDHVKVIITSSTFCFLKSHSLNIVSEQGNGNIWSRAGENTPATDHHCVHGLVCFRLLVWLNSCVVREQPAV